MKVTLIHWLFKRTWRNLMKMFYISKSQLKRELIDRTLKHIITLVRTLALTLTLNVSSAGSAHDNCLCQNPRSLFQTEQSSHDWRRRFVRWETRFNTTRRRVGEDVQNFFDPLPLFSSIPLPSTHSTFIFSSEELNCVDK